MRTIPQIILALALCCSGWSASGVDRDTVVAVQALTNLAVRIPVPGERVRVQGYKTAGDWGNYRDARHVPGDTTATNRANVIAAKDGGRYIFDDRLNEQRLSWWGAVGDGVTDDTKAIQDAASFCDANFKTLVIPEPIGSKYLVSTSIWFKCNVQCLGRPVLWTTNNQCATGITGTSVGSPAMYLEQILPAAKLDPTYRDHAQSNSIGYLILGTDTCNIRIGNTDNQTVGIKVCPSNGLYSAWNDFKLTRHSTHRYAAEITYGPDAVGLYPFVTENTFRKGEFYSGSSRFGVTNANYIALYIHYPTTNAWTDINHNVFESPSFEGGAWGNELWCEGRDNLFNWIRVETGTGVRGHFTFNSTTNHPVETYGNKVSGGFMSPHVRPAVSQKGTAYGNNVVFEQGEVITGITTEFEPLVTLHAGRSSDDIALAIVPAPGDPYGTNWTLAMSATRMWGKARASDPYPAITVEANNKISLGSGTNDLDSSIRGEAGGIRIVAPNGVSMGVAPTDPSYAFYAQFATNKDVWFFIANSDDNTNASAGLLVSDSDITGGIRALNPSNSTPMAGHVDLRTYTWGARAKGVSISALGDSQEVVTIIGGQNGLGPENRRVQVVSNGVSIAKDGVGATNPPPFVLLALNSTNGGLLLPRPSAGNVAAMAGAPSGTIFHDTNGNQFYLAQTGALRKVVTLGPGETLTASGGSSTNYAFAYAGGILASNTVAETVLFEGVVPTNGIVAGVPLSGEIFARFKSAVANTYATWRVYVGRSGVATNLVLSGQSAINGGGAGHMNFRGRLQIVPQVYGVSGYLQNEMMLDTYGANTATPWGTFQTQDWGFFGGFDTTNVWSSTNSEPMYVKLTVANNVASSSVAWILYPGTFGSMSQANAVISPGLASGVVPPGSYTNIASVTVDTYGRVTGVVTSSLPKVTMYYGSTNAAGDNYQTNTYTIPAGARDLEFYLVAAGNGGASGRRGAAGTQRYGGGGGGGGGVSLFTYPAKLLGGPGATVTVWIGKPGAGGAPVSVDDSNGNNGGTAYATSVLTNGYIILSAYGGGGAASGGSAANGNGGQASGGGTWGSVNGNGGSATYGAGYGPAAPGGGGGGAITAANAASAGSASGFGSPMFRPGGWGNVGGGANTGGNGSDGISVIYPWELGYTGAAGGGGGANLTGAGGQGGQGGYGAGGGGGGASVNGFNSGGGGAGGPGYVRIVAR